MEESKFTPGPWIASTCLVRSEDGSEICRTSWVSDQGPSVEAAHANAVLCAAAPDLYEALIGAIETIFAWYDRGTRDAESWTLYQASPEMTAIHAAIAKAEGQEVIR